MADEIKRLNYFTGQFLDAQDFRDEQTYHKEMRWRGNRSLFAPGVWLGLQVSGTADGKAIVVSPGLAFDAQGHELVVLAPPTGTQAIPHPVPTGRSGWFHVIATYKEELSDSHSVGGYTGATRVTEQAELGFVETTGPQVPPPNGVQIVLATLLIGAGGTIANLTSSTAQRSSLVLGPEVQNRKLVLRGPNAPNASTNFQELSYEFASAGSARVRAFRGGSWGTSLQLLTNSPGTGSDKPDVRLHVDESGDIGIGTQQPASRLHVVGAHGIAQNELHLSGGVGWSSLSYNAHHNSANGAWVFRDPTRTAVTLEVDDGLDDGSATGRKARFDIYTTTRANKTTWTHRLRVDGDSGHMGVGTDTPGARLHVKGDAGVLNVEGTTHAYLQWYPKETGAGRKAWLGFGNAVDADAGALSLTSEAGVVRICGKQGVRIGREAGGAGTLAVASTLTAEADLTVAGSVKAASAGLTGAVKAASAAITGSISAGSLTAAGSATVGSATVTGNLSAGSAVVTGHLTTGTGGCVGVGISGNPLAPLHIGSAGPTAIRLEDPSSMNHFDVHYEMNNRTVVFYHNGGVGQYMPGQGPQAGNWCKNSDRTMKTNVAELSGTLGTVMKLRPVSFRWIENDTPGIGFIAQDVEALLPELVSEHSPDGTKTVKGLAYAPFAVLAIAAIQDMKNEYDALIRSIEERVRVISNVNNRER